MDAPREVRQVVNVGQIERSIIVLGGQRVMLDSDLAALYGVSVKVLNPDLLTYPRPGMSGPEA